MSSFEKDLEEILHAEVDLEKADSSAIKKAAQIKAKEKYGHSLNKFIKEYANRKGIFPSTLKKIWKSYKKQAHYKASSINKIQTIKELLQDLGFAIKTPEYEKIWVEGVFGYLNNHLSETEIGKEGKSKELIEEIKYSIKIKANKKYNSLESFFEDISQKFNTTLKSMQVQFARTKNTKLSTLIRYQQILNYLNSKEDTKSF